MRRQVAVLVDEVGRAWSALISVVALGLTLFAVVPPAAARAATDPPSAAACAAPANEIVAENCKVGSPPSDWEVSGAGDDSIQGFATDISVNQGQTVDFRIDTTVADYRIDIYRLGYYGGDGARLVDTIPTGGTDETNQPDCPIIDGTTDDNLVDCGNWSISASWTVPNDAVSGIYIARPTATNGEASHIVFIVRDDDGASELLFQTSDTTWQAYNRYGGYSLYDGPGHAHKVSYNRPFTTRSAPTEDWLFNAEYPMVRWLERNGYDVSYFTDVDSDRYGSEILEHETFLSVGHDEYWSAGQRANVTAARDAGVNLAFFSSNEIYWKTRFEPSPISSGNNYRTLVSYKEGSAQGSEHYECMTNYSCDPDPAVWTGLWRENTTGHDGGLPENALSGQISWGDMTTAIEVPAAYTGLRLWRNTDMSGDTTLTDGTLGYEIDWEQDAYASWYPAGRITMSETTVTTNNIPVGPKTHKLSLYRAASGALVFGAGTAQWSWGLDTYHDRASSSEDPRIQQATVNMLSDMGAQPATLQADLVPGGPLDTVPPTTAIVDPASGTTVAGGNIAIAGTAGDTGGRVAAVELSVDGGTTWTHATGTTNWTGTVHAVDRPVTVIARAIDDSANIGAPVSVDITAGPQTCPCSIFAPTVTGVEENDSAAVELGVKFRSDVAGYITGIRFYKTAENTGIHTGTLWSSQGTNLATATFSAESATGWQLVSFGAPVAIDADTTYVASYHTNVGYYAIGTSFAVAGVDNPPLHALANGVDGLNGVYAYGPGGSYPTVSFGSSNYLVDVVFETSVAPDVTAPIVSTHRPATAATGVDVTANVTATFNEPIAPASVSGSTVELRDPSNNLVPATVSYNAGTRTAIVDPTSALEFSTTYTATVKGGLGNVTDVAGNALTQHVTWAFTTAALPPPQPSEGPGGPILVVSSSANPFSRYYTEILRNEGLNEFYAVDLTDVTATMLADYDVVVLGEIAVDAAQASMLATWVDGGGNLIAMRPDPDLTALLGLTATGTSVSDAYLQIETAAGKPGAGLV
ncbi:MAG TPA: N,N-dimethylformamidase beta subunit family domain-containing protein, partial [Ilumatobacteraceae bacterium]